MARDRRGRVRDTRADGFNPDLVLGPRRARRVVNQPDVFAGLARGIRTVVDAIRPTLGPFPRLTVLQGQVETRSPELLDDGALIARRIIELPDPDADVGAMLVRQALWRLHETVGDGTATAALVFEAAFSAGVRYIVAGGNAMRLRRSLERSAVQVLAALKAQARPVRGKAQLAGLAASLGADRELAPLLGEIFDIIGEHGPLQVQTGHGRGLEREYVEGMTWRTQRLGRATTARVEMSRAAVLLSDLEIDDPRELGHALGQMAPTGQTRIVLVAARVGERALGVLAANPQLQVLLVKVPGLRSDDQADALQDLAALTGARALRAAAGDRLSAITADAFGQARLIWTTRDHFGVIGGGGDAKALRAHIRELKRSASAATDADIARRLGERMSRLLGGSATLLIGGATESALNARKATAERVAAALRGALRDGVLPGGGVAARRALAALRASSADPDDQAALRIVRQALLAPTRALLANAGEDPSAVLAELTQAGDGAGFDLRTRQVTDMAAAGVLDSAAAQIGAIRTGLLGAALALTIDVVIHRRQPPVASEP
jgi:chaperonin GroEL